MLGTVTLTGAWEILFYIGCAYIAIDFLFIALPRCLNKVLDRIIEKRDKKTMEEKSKIDGLLVCEIEKKIELYKSEKSMEGLSESDKKSLGARIAALEDVVTYWNNKWNNNKHL